ncbi:tetratricopeptide repeat protein [uncultured Polaribacter sp.]|uniref:type IX secretion system periplasmic lipoprotein PorW/SprE n=1 Tax=uncultured Polaribacter sp. TaxID=174711 RepID=UPI00260CE37E|nr:tetratricopeptide repeat protein [uncultured Polaribacter sp.]
MKYIKKILVFTILATLIYACSSKKDTITSRNYHAMTSYFNILFNGEEAFEEGLEGIRNSYKDDWFEQLIIEPIEFDDRKIVVAKFNGGGLGAGFGGNKKVEAEASSGTPFDKAEEKAVKAIQLHGMNIDGLERNSQIDDAYFLLGKARYYTQRFVPAIEAFNYVIANYPDADLIAETKIWRAKANIRLNNEEFAIETINLLLKVTDTLEQDFPDLVKEKGHTALAMAYVQSDSLQKVKKHLKLATRTQKNRSQAARNMFVLGQIYAKENKKDSAVMVFNKLSNFKKAPYKYKIHAVIELAKNSPNDSVSAVALERLRKLIKKRENRPYLDELYFQVGAIHENYNSIKLAKEFYNNSLRALNGTDKQKSYTYENLGNLYFKEAAYQLASSYYDSVLAVATDTLDLRIRRVKRKFKNLASLIKYENVVATNDSILKIAALPKEAQETFFKEYIAKIKKADEDAAQLKLNQAAFGGSGNSLQSTKNRGKWYFYNNQILNFGKSEFKRVWGDRKLEDNWRWSSSVVFNESEVEVAETKTIDAKYDLETYLKTIPTEESSLDTLKLDRNQALYELGLIYKEQFKNPNLAAERLERVKGLNPIEPLILPINWHLYQIYKSLEDAKASLYKNKILNDYPETIFAQIIKNPDKKITEDKDISELEKQYKELYLLYKKARFRQVLVETNTILETIGETKLKPKFELLKAYAIGKYLDAETYKEALEFVAVNYGNTEEGKKAQEIITQLSK